MEQFTASDIKRRNIVNGSLVSGRFSLLNHSYPRCLNQTKVVVGNQILGIIQLLLTVLFFGGGGGNEAEKPASKE